MIRPSTFWSAAVTSSIACLTSIAVSGDLNVNVSATRMEVGPRWSVAKSTTEIILESPLSCCLILSKTGAATASPQ